MNDKRLQQHPDFRIGQTGKVQVPAALIKKQQYRNGRAPNERWVVEGVTKQHSAWIRESAKANNMSVSVFVAFLAECLHDGRVLILPPSHSIEEYIDGRFRDLMNREVEKTVATVLGKAGMADPYRR